jgi:hypothetical protein
VLNLCGKFGALLFAFVLYKTLQVVRGQRKEFRSILSDSHGKVRIRSDSASGG